MANKIAFIFPGYMEHSARYKYKKIENQLEDRGYKVVFWDSDWSRQTLTSMTRHFARRYRHAGNRDVLLFGHSLGAMLALVLAERV